MHISRTFKQAQRKRARRRLLDVTMVARDRVSRREWQTHNSWFQSPRHVQILNLRAFARGVAAART